MANRTFNQDFASTQKRIRFMWPIVSVGAAGAVTLQKRTYRAQGVVGSSPSSVLGAAPTSGQTYAYSDGEGVQKVVRNGTGDWTFTLSDPYQYLLGIQLIQTTNATGLLTSGFGVGVIPAGTNVATNTSTGSGGTIEIVLNNGSGSATDPASGDVLYFAITLGDATEP